MIESYFPEVTLDKLEEISNRASTIIERLPHLIFASGTVNSLDLSFNVRTASEMIGRSETLIHEAESYARLPAPDKDEKTSPRTGYSLHQINQMRRIGEPTDLSYALRATYWPNLALIGANLGIYDAEYELAAHMTCEPGFVLDRLRDGIDSIKDRFDVILLNPPPALGMISLSVLLATNTIIVLTPPNNVNFGSASRSSVVRAAISPLTICAQTIIRNIHISLKSVVCRMKNFFVWRHFQTQMNSKRVRSNRFWGMRQCVPS